MPRTLVVWSARPSQPRMRCVGAAGRAAPGQHRRQIAGAEADQRVVGIERGHDDLADLALGDRIAGARAHDLDDHAFVERPGPRAPRSRRRPGRGRRCRSSGSRRCRAPASQSRSAGGNASPPTRAPSSATAGRRRSRRPSRAGCAGSSACRRRRRAAGRPSPAAAARSGRCPPGTRCSRSRTRAAVHHRAGRREVIAEAVVHQVAGAKAGGEQGATHAPVVGAARSRARRSGRARRTRASRAARRRGARPSRSPRSRRRRRSPAPARCRSSSSRLRSTGSARQRGAAGDSARVDAGEASPQPPARSPGHGRPARRARAISAASRCSGSRVSSASKWSLTVPGSLQSSSKRRAAELRVLDQLALLGRRRQGIAVEAAAAGLLEVGEQGAVLDVEVDEGVVAAIEDAGALLLHALDLAQLAQQQRDRLQGFGIGAGHGAPPQESQRLRRL